MGSRALRGGWDGGLGAAMVVACWMTAGVMGSIRAPVSSRAGVMRSWVLESVCTGVSRLARRSMMASLTVAYGSGFRRMSRRREYHCRS